MGNKVSTVWPVASLVRCGDLTSAFLVFLPSVFPLCAHVLQKIHATGQIESEIGTPIQERSLCISKAEKYTFPQGTPQNGRACR